jgi:hypothetical protein
MDAQELKAVIAAVKDEMKKEEEGAITKWIRENPGTAVIAAGIAGVGLGAALQRMADEQKADDALAQAQFANQTTIRKVA